MSEQEEIASYLSQNVRSKKRFIKALIRYSTLKETQFLYLQLVKSDTLNPFMNIIRKLSGDALNEALPPSMLFYLRKTKGEAEYKT